MYGSTGGDGEDRNTSCPVQGLSSKSLSLSYTLTNGWMKCKWKLIGEEVNRPAASCKDIYRHRILGSGDQIVS